MGGPITEREYIPGGGLLDADVVTVNNRSGRNDPPVAHTLSSSAGHRPVPEHVTQARRSQVQISAASGQQLFDESEHELQHRAQKAAAMANAVLGEIAKSPVHAGGLGGGTALARPTDQLPWLMAGAD